MFFKRSKKFNITVNNCVMQGKESKTILDTILRARDVDFKYSCGSGECGQCRYHLVSGEVKTSPNAAGLLACQSYPKSDIEIIQ
ncbi:2Fe-2S iron-sulfur cluster-binding protein [Pseudoalteromonas sp. T1lg65]|uniref:2Fe-2S iron-sulfur cluster-binding protein n=1 Tax=Pseudoalteromonas sp. T1lg65 TaxID=2077101 RepID=UPI003F7A653F